MTTRDPSLCNALRDVLTMTTRRAHVRAARASRRGIAFPAQPRRRRQPGSVWGIAVVKDERDVIAGTIDHMLGQGVDWLLVADNGSTDGTFEWLEQRALTAPITVVRDREPAHYQAQKMTRLAHWAARRGADWIVPFDADERWLAPGDTLAGFLRRQPVDVVTAQIHNVFPVRGGDGEIRLRRLDLTPHPDVKVAFRAHPLMLLLPGNHAVVRPGPVGDGPAILHLPWRSVQQVAGKVRAGAQALRAAGDAEGVGTHWHAMAVLDDAALRAVWARLLEGQPDPAITWSPQGPFVLADVTSWTRWDPPGVPGGVAGGVPGGVAGGGRRGGRGSRWRRPQEAGMAQRAEPPVIL